MNARMLKNGGQYTYTVNNVRVRFHFEGGVYHVAAYDTEDSQCIVSKVFHRFDEAKKKYNRYLKIAGF